MEFNENPRVLLLKEEIKRLKEESKTQKEKIELYEDEIIRLNAKVRYRDAIIDRNYLGYRQRTKVLEDFWVRMGEEIKRFKTTPWFKKICFKFKV